VFVLDKKLQDGDSLPKWKKRCWTGAYIGQSLQHGGNVPLIYNPLTTHISPQYHVTFDDQFSTVTGTTATLTEEDYDRLYNTTEWLYPDKFGNPVDLHLFELYWSDPPPVRASPTSGCNKLKYAKRIPRPSNPTLNTTNTTNSSLIAGASDTADAGRSANASELANAGNESNASKSADASESADANPSIEKHTNTQSAARDVTSAPYINLCQLACSDGLEAYKVAKGIIAHVYTAVSTVYDPTPPLVPVKEEPFHKHILSNTALLSEVPTVSLTGSDNKTDILTQGQMFKAPDASKFVACQADEIASLHELDIMDIQPIQNLPHRARLLSSIWSYRRKRLPNGVLFKYKARLCVNGKEQAFGRDYWETYAPVASWSTIRLLLSLSTVMNLQTRQEDYTSAFPQAKLDMPVFMRVPQGWHVNTQGRLAQHPDPKFQDKSQYLRLKKNLYGCKQAARNWFKMLSEGLIAEGFVQSTTDSCLFLCNDCVIVVYVDDCLFFSPKSTTIDTVIASLSKIFKLKDEGDVSAFLGVQITKDSHNRTISFTQPGLINQIIRDVGILTSSKGKETPVDSILHPDLDGPSRVENWNYRSVIGKLNYLANNTRPDISMAVHQCARFTSAPKALHELAVKRIIRYLLATKSKGLSLRPTTTMTLDMFVDADFAGRWHKEFSHLRDNVLSRTGYVITFCGCPVSWASRLQSEIALSTTESEYIALSMATRELLPLRRILHDIVQYSFITLPHSNPATVNTSTFQSSILPSKVYEDNTAYIVLATSDSHFKPRTKHISLKFHHFNDQVKTGVLQIVKVDSAHNWADIFTKPLGRIKFEHLRKLLMGW
jgi:hypothetical protein